MRLAAASSHELAQACLEARIAAGDIAHHSGKAEDFGRKTRERLQALWSLQRYDCYTRCDFDVVRNWAGECRAIIDTDAGYWDHVISQAAYDRFAARRATPACQPQEAQERTDSARVGVGRRKAPDALSEAEIAPAGPTCDVGSGWGTACACTDQRDCPHWRPASHGASRLRWGAARFAGREWAEGSNGRTIWVASFEAAQALADRLNAPIPTYHRLQHASPEKTLALLYAKHGRLPA